MPQWELLVTQGHVRAARWRKAVPLLLVVSIAAIILAILLARSMPGPRPSTAVSEAKTAYAANLRRAVGAFFANPVRVPELPPQQAAQVPASEAVATRLTAILAALNRTNELPDSVVSQDADTFWRGEWGAARFHAVEDGTTILIGGYVNVAYQSAEYSDPPELRRRYWILRRPASSWFLRDDPPYGWAAHCLAVVGALPCEGNALEPATIPGTMRDLLPSAAFEARR